ncbi:hypothetical protein [Prevotella sp. FD3004]|uniref:hypothetical protein n=1 Tax=Prevotella sp. FD3004 TaxID=1408309 RepID=UPI0005642D29|nr:hypothetical protein [Prevotella sp. FD3004]
MKTKNLITILIGIASLFSCSNQNDAVNEVSLEGQLVKMDINEDKWPKWMLGDYIYARDHDFNLHLGKLTKTEWQKTERVFVCGQGHNEFGLMALSQDNKGALYVLDLPVEGAKLFSLTIIRHPDNVATIKNPTNWEKYDLRQLPPFLQNGDTFVVLSDSTILVTGAPANDMHHVLSVINFKSLTVTPLDYWPEDDTPENLTEEKWITYTSGSGIKSNGKDRFLYWDNSGKLAFIFTIDGAKTNILSHIYSDRLPIPGIDKTPSTESIHCCADNDRIYLLYMNSNSKGEKIEKFDRKDPFPMGNTVEVYDWDGVKQQVIHLDKLGKVIMLSKDSKTLYLYSRYMQDGSDPYIYSYDLNTLKP